MFFLSPGSAWPSADLRWPGVPSTDLPTPGSQRRAVPRALISNNNREKETLNVVGCLVSFTAERVQNCGSAPAIK